VTGCPANLRAYKTTPRFTAVTVPVALTQSHQTKAGIWGQIRVLDGILHLTRFDETGQVAAEEAIAAGDSAFVHPEEPHSVALDDDTAFQVTFLREDDQAATCERI